MEKDGDDEQNPVCTGMTWDEFEKNVVECTYDSIHRNITGRVDVMMRLFYMLPWLCVIMAVVMIDSLIIGVFDPEAYLVVPLIPLSCIFTYVGICVLSVPVLRRMHPCNLFVLTERERWFPVLHVMCHAPSIDKSETRAFLKPRVLVAVDMIVERDGIEKWREWSPCEKGFATSLVLQQIWGVKYLTEDLSYWSFLSFRPIRKSDVTTFYESLKSDWNHMFHGEAV